MSTKWRDSLKEYLEGKPPLFDAPFMERWGELKWDPQPADRTAAAKLHTQIISRITTQRLGYLDGVEKTALDSVYALFELTRTICEANPSAHHFEAIAWHVLNSHVRPFTAKWHRVSQGGGLEALDATDEFRAELAERQSVLEQFERLLTQLRGGQAPTIKPGKQKSEGEEKIEGEMGREVKWGIPKKTGGITDVGGIVDEINAAERRAILARRRYYRELASAAGETPTQGHEKEKPHAIGLALSGGGIRSATFSLGVLVALAGRGVLPQFDYLSTVSGGGYLGSFLSAFLNSAREGKQPNVGLRANQLPFLREGGEPETLRHLRHHSKYLATGSLWERVKMMSAQVFGMFVNFLGVAWIAVLLVLLERLLRGWPLIDGLWQPLTRMTAWVWLIGAIIALFFWRFARELQKHADLLITLPMLALAGLLAWRGLDSIHAWYEKATLWWRCGFFILTGVIPFFSCSLAGLFSRSLRGIGAVILAVSAMAAPLFFVLVYLHLYEYSVKENIQFGGSHPFLVWTIIIVGGLFYFFLLNINVTSPHRHYRKKLVEAYLIRPAEEKSAERPFDDSISVRLSQLREWKPLQGEGEALFNAPYHLINCALNVPGSSNPRMQGRPADFFLFSPRYCGSPLTGYEKTEDWERVDRHLDLGTAMAISGAAAAPQMGLGTMRRLSFWLALLNVRLGYWVQTPGILGRLGGVPGLRFLLKEMLGTMNEKSSCLNVSDGGHIENLGVYELLRRRCKYIVAIDGEQDPQMTFHALTTLQRLAFIDLGITIDINLDDLRLNKLGLSRSHFRFCRICYGDRPGAKKEYGYLLYLKLSLTGNEGEFIRRYRLDEPVFPHHSTADQFFSETQFEAYRNLGEHVGEKLFLRALLGPLADRKPPDEVPITIEEWFQALGENLLEPLREAEPAPPGQVAGAQASAPVAGEK